MWRASPVCGTASREELSGPEAALSGPEAGLNVVKRPAAECPRDGWQHKMLACRRWLPGLRVGLGVRVRLPFLQCCGCSVVALCACSFLSFVFCRENPRISERGGCWHHEGSHLWGTTQGARGTLHLVVALLLVPWRTVLWGRPG